MNNLKILSLIFICCSTFISSALAQGTLIGVISDSISGIDLPGANVMLEGTAIGASTDVNGEYRISGIKEGSYNIVVSYIGYQDKIIPIDISKDETKVLSIRLIPIAIEGEVITITAQAEGQIAAINQQIKSNTIVNVVSEEKIQELPDANAAEAIGRLPGVSVTREGGEANKVLLRGMQAKFSVITIDGVKVPATEETGRGVDLSTISQSSLAGIELAKAITPDKDGDALAGSINLVTKKAPEARELKTNIKGNYNDLMESYNQYDLSLRYGERFFNSILGVQLVGNLEKKIRSNERFDIEWRYDTGDDKYRVNDFNVNFRDEIRTRKGFSILLDINTPDDGTIRINNIYGGTKRDYLTHFRDYPLDGEYTVYDYRQREQNINTYNSSVHGDNHLFDFGLNWGVAYAESKSEYPFDYQLIFWEDGMRAPYPTIFDYKEIPERLIPLARNDFTEAWQAWGYYRDQDNSEIERTAFLDISREYNINSSIFGEIKVGTKFKSKDRTNITGENFSPYYLDGQWKFDELAPDGTVRPKDFSGTYFEDWFNSGANGGAMPLIHFFPEVDTRNVYDKYELTPLVIKERLKQWQKLNKSGVDPTGNRKEVWINPLYRVNDYDITENVSAFYLMNTLKFGQKITFISGLRTEHEYNNYDAYYMKSRVGGFPLAEDVLFDTTSSAQQTVYLPNFHLAYEATDYLKIRLAAYKALARPDFNMRIDRYVGGRGAVIGSAFEVQVGNIELKTAEAWNYEINTSVYNHKVGLISLSTYYKEIKNMYHMLEEFGTSGEWALDTLGSKWISGMGGTAYDLTIPYNSKKPTKVWGFEFEHQINFHFLPGYLKGIVLSYNASIVRS
ncbi:MAG: carboxypeptidase-like regulatory domain-containing protein, partial [Calditrichaceae bacterium]|nr:carboxypeptidase-like regulatory domain-containing protein [Calditrichaceae bacterium]